MSDLAYNLNGEPFEVPGAATGWRVRKLKAKGAPEVVYGREGIPLVLPIDADMDDLRREVRAEGRYRVDALDEHSRPIAGCPAGYVCIHDGEPRVEPLPVAKPAATVTTADQALVEAMRIQAGLAQSVVDRFSMILEASATLLRAAENAGMPQRLPRFFLDTPKEEDGEGDDQDEASDRQGEPTPTVPKSGLPAFIDTILTAGAPALVNAIVNGRIKIPGGLGALIDCRRAIPRDRGAAEPSTNIPGVTPAPGHEDPAPAVCGAVSTPPTPPSPGQPPDPDAFERAPHAAKSPGPDLPEGLPTIDATTMQHFHNILSALSLDEQMLARNIAAELSPADLRTWMRELAPMSVAKGVAKIRAFLALHARPRRESGGDGEANDGGALNTLAGGGVP